MKPAPFDFVAATSIGEAVSLLAEVEGARVIAGGQSLMPLLAMRLARPALLVDVNGLGLDDISVPVGSGEVRIGGLIRQRRLERDPVVAEACPLLAEAVALVGHPAIRNRGTLGGSLAHGDPRAELATTLLALGGSVIVEGPGGRRTVPASDLWTGPFTTTLAADEVLVEVVAPVAVAGDGSAFCEWTPRTRDFAEAGVAVVVHCADGEVSSVSAAACGVASTPVDLSDALAAVVGSGLPADALLREVAGSVGAACARTGDPDRAELAGLLAARATWRAVRRAHAGAEVAA